MLVACCFSEYIFLISDGVDKVYQQKWNPDDPDDGESCPQMIVSLAKGCHSSSQLTHSKQKSKVISDVLFNLL